jgi:hypothetical protein
LTLVFGVWADLRSDNLATASHHTPTTGSSFSGNSAWRLWRGSPRTSCCGRRRERGEIVSVLYLLVVAALSVLPLLLWLFPTLEIVPRGPGTFEGALHPCVAGGVTLVLFWLLREGRLTHRRWAIAACALTFTDLYAFGHRYNPAVDRGRVFTCVRAPSSSCSVRRECCVAAVEWTTFLPNTACLRPCTTSAATSFRSLLG